MEEKLNFHKVLKALHLLKKYKVSFNVLTCVTKFSSQYPWKYSFKEQGVEYIQFIPIVERMPDKNALQLRIPSCDTT